MGLSERKIKQRIGADPRNLAWSGDTNRFSYQHMSKLGWDDSRGLGANGGGNPNHIAVVRKTDNTGIGMARAKKDGDDMAAGAGQAGRGLEDVLRRLASASASASPSPAPESPALEVATDIKKRNKIASRQKHLHSKRLASSSPAALAEILGVPISSLPGSPSPGPSTPASPAPVDPTPASPDADSPSENERTSEEIVTKSTLSVTDYFRQKMREKMLARQAASGGSVDLLAALPEEKKVDIGGVAWEGSKVNFDDVQVKLEHLGGDAGPSTSSEPNHEAERAARRARKEAKRSKKLVKAERASPETEAPASVTQADFEETITVKAEPVDSTVSGRVESIMIKTEPEDQKTRERREKKERKEAKRQSRAEAQEGEDRSDKKRKRVRDGEEKPSKEDRKKVKEE